MPLFMQWEIAPEIWVVKNKWRWTDASVRDSYMINVLICQYCLFRSVLYRANLAKDYPDCYATKNRFIPYRQF